MRPIGPDPMLFIPPRVVFLKPLVTSPLIEVGEYSYYGDPQHPEPSNPAMSCTTTARTGL